MSFFLSRQVLNRLFATKLQKIAPRLAVLSPQEILEGDLKDDLGMDSMEIMELAAYFHGKFHMPEAGVEFYLLSCKKAEEWLDRIEHVANNMNLPISFFTSGSTGPAKACTHNKQNLLEEVEFWIKELKLTGNIWGLVSPIHIYGFIFTLLVPDKAGLTYREAKQESLYDMIKQMHSVDCIIGFPEIYQFLTRSQLEMPAGIRAISSTAPLLPEIAQQLAGNGVRLMEIYGSSESGGIGHRSFPNQDYNLLPFWRKKGEDLYRVSPDNKLETHFNVPDNLLWKNNNQFCISGRKDQAIQIGGNNVYPLQIASKIKSIPGVKDCWIRKMTPQEGQRLKCWIQTDIPCAEWGQLEQNSYHWIESNLSAPERPKHIHITSQAPTNEMGKINDWPITQKKNVQA